jgi:hypothetical protein
LASILNLLKILTLVDSLAADIWAAAELPMPDFEDATIAILAKRNQLDYIVTRNLKDYALSPVPAISPADCLKRLKYIIRQILKHGQVCLRHTSGAFRPGANVYSPLPRIPHEFIYDVQFNPAKTFLMTHHGQIMIYPYKGFRTDVQPNPAKKMHSTKKVWHISRIFDYIWECMQNHKPFAKILNPDLQVRGRRLPSAVCRLPSAVCRLPSAVCRLPSESQ